MKPEDPLVVTLRCGGAGWDLCGELRRLHFPPERNVVPVHIALFHHLPGTELRAVTAQARRVVEGILPFTPQVTKVRSLGRGVAFAVQSAELLLLRAELAALWEQWLIPQDRGRFSAHITIQNKVTPQQARELLNTLEREFVPFFLEALGVEIWHYRGGPWEPAAFLAFRAATSEPL